MSDADQKAVDLNQAQDSYIRELARVADRALVTGDHSRCVAIVENIYDLLDLQSRRIANIVARPGLG